MEDIIDKGVLQPTCQFRLIVRASSEGEASMKAILHLQANVIMAGVTEKIRFVEAQEKKAK